MPSPTLQTLSVKRLVPVAQRISFACSVRCHIIVYALQIIFNYQIVVTLPSGDSQRREQNERKYPPHKPPMRVSAYIVSTNHILSVPPYKTEMF